MELKTQGGSNASTGKTILLIVCTLVGYLVTQIIGGVAAGILGVGDGYEMQFICSVPTFIFYIVMLYAVMKKKKILSTTGNGVLEGFLTGGFILFIVFSGLISTFIGYDEEKTQVSFCLPEGNFGSEQVWCILAILLSAGICEELMTRGIILNALRDRFGRDSYKGTLTAIFIQGILFGCMHFMNLTNGVSLSTVLIQVVSTAGVGIFLGAVYCRSGCLWVNIILHFLMDIVILLPLSMQSNQDLSESIETSMSDPTKYLAFFLYAGIALFLLRPSKKETLCSYSID